MKFQITVVGTDKQGRHGGALISYCLTARGFLVWIPVECEWLFGSVCWPLEALGDLYPASISTGIDSSSPQRILGIDKEWMERINR